MKLLAGLICLLVSLATPNATGQSDKDRTLQTLTVRSTSSATWGRSVVTAGFPISSKANIHDPNRLLLRRRPGKEIPAFFEVQARHQGRADDLTRPIRWLLVTFAAEGLGEGDTIVLAERQTKPSSGPRKRSNTIRTDRLHLKLLNKQLDLFGSCGVASRQFASRASGRLLATDADGQSIQASPWNINLHRGTNGFHRLVAKASIGGVDAKLTLNAIDGADDVSCRLTLTNHGPYGHDGTKSAHRTFRRLAITLPSPDGPLSLTFAGGKASVRRDGDFLALLQDHAEDGPKGAPDRLWFEAHTRRGLLKRGRKGMGILTLKSTRGTMGISVEHFAEMAPKALSIQQNGLVLDILPARADENSVHVIEGARATTTRFRLSFCKSPRGLLKRLRRENDRVLHLLSAPDQVWAARPIIFPYRPTPAAPSAAVSRFDRLMRLAVDDSAADPTREGERIGLPRFLARGGTYGKQASLGWMNFGDVPWGDGFCSLHYDWPFGILLQYLRTGDVRFFDLGRTMAQHRASIDQSHDTTSQVAGRGGQFYEKGDNHGNAFSPAISHTWIGGLLLNALLTGDSEAWEAIELSTAFARRRDLGNWNGLWGARLPGWAADLFLARFDILRDPDDLKMATEILARVELIETNEHKMKGFIANRGAKPPHVKPWMHAILATSVARHILVTGSDQFRPLLGRLLAFLRQHAVHQNSVGRFHTTRIWEAGRKREPSVHLNWAMVAAFSWGFAATQNPADAELARALFRDTSLYFQGGSTPSAVTFRPRAYPGSESKIFSNIALWGVTGTSLHH